MRHSRFRRRLGVDIDLLCVASCFVFVIQLHDHFTVFGFETHAYRKPIRDLLSSHSIEGFQKGLFIDDRDVPLDVYQVTLTYDPGLHTFCT
jgi:hypothetical protein